MRASRLSLEEAKQQQQQKKMVARFATVYRSQPPLVDLLAV